MAKICFLFVLVHLIWASIVSTSAQRNPAHGPYSLQAAIDLLHRREAQLAMRDYDNGHQGAARDEARSETESDAFNLKKQNQINRLLAKYLEQDEQNDNDYDDNEPDIRDWYNSELEERKRSVFRERGNDEEDIPQSVFRERELSTASGNPSNNLGYYGKGHSELAQEFMREINDERNRERDELFRENLQNVLAKYEQEEENAIEREILADELQRNAIIEGARLQHELKDRNNHRQAPQWNSEAAERAIEKRRLTLPWLPASRRKRFPISKRSSNGHANKHELEETNDKVAHDLQAIFGDSGSTGAKPSPDIHLVAKKSDRSVDLHAHHLHNGSEEEDHSHEDEHDHSHEHHDHHDDEEEDEDDEEDRKKKKKRSTVVEARPNITTAKSQPEELKLDQLISSTPSQIDKTLQISKKSKKSIEWSKYFGLDRKKKSVDDWFMSPHKSNQNEHEMARVDDIDNRRIDNEFSNEKIDNIDRKLKAIENHIIEDTVKYTGAHDHAADPEELEMLKNRVISRLATAYSLEKMRRALNKLKEANELAQPAEQSNESSEELVEKKSNRRTMTSVATAYSLENRRRANNKGGEQAQDSAETNDKKPDSDKTKRIAVKKEGVEFDNKLHNIESTNESGNKITSDSEPNDINSFDGAAPLSDDDKKKKKRNGQKSLHGLSDDSDDQKYLRYGRYDPSQVYVNHYRNGDENLDECPILDAIDKRCESVDLLGGGGGRHVYENDALLPACTMHQFCYLCGTSQTFCDFQYLSDTEAICGPNKDCQSTAHLVLMILRGSTTGPQQVGPKECAKNPCLLQAMKNIAGY